MTVPFVLRFDFRNPSFAGTSAADRFDAAIRMAEWADNLGCVSITVSEHHGSPDGYLPSPLPVLAAMAPKTNQVRFTVAALIAPFYHPLRLAEDMVVLDHLSRGRVDVVVAGGYVAEEFAMYGVPLSARATQVTEVVTTLKAAFSGEPFEYRGRRVKVTPEPYRPGGPAVLLGGSSEAAARRAARIADGFLPSIPEVWEFYQDELRSLGLPDPGPCPVGPGPQTMALAADVETGWEQMGPYFLHEANAYGEWLAGSDGAGPYQKAASLDDLRASGQYLIVNPEEHIEILKAAPTPFAVFHPLCGGIPPELAWSSLRLFEGQVLPAFA